MRLTTSEQSARVGGVRIHAVQKVVELDSGTSGLMPSLLYPSLDSEVVHPAALHSIAAQMAIVVPCMNEDIATIEGVLSGIPHDSLIILVSNSSRGGDGTKLDAYARELEALERFSSMSNRPAMAIHQRDLGLSHAFQAAGMPELVDDETHMIRSGKGEAMLVGSALAAIAGRKYIGFVDADNFVPGSVHEYCNAFAAGLHMAQGERRDHANKVMVRLSWRCKPKIRNNKLDFTRAGRSSRITNRWLNNLLAALGGADASKEIIATGNAGEHAMSVELALKMRFAGGFAVEPFQYLDLLERFGGDESKRTSIGSDGMPQHSSSSSTSSSFWGHGLVEVLQIETRNPHFHQDKGDAHVKDMWAQALGVVHRSTVTPLRLRDQIAEFAAEKGACLPGPEKTRIYPPLETLDLLHVWRLLETKATSLRLIGDPRWARAWPSSPIKGE